MLPWTAGRYTAGSAYRANEVAALQWVHATLVETALLTHDLVLPAPRPDGEREQYWDEARLFRGLVRHPASRFTIGLGPSFTAYNEAMWGADILTVSPAARTIAEQILLAAWQDCAMPKMKYLALTAHLLPERLRRRSWLELGRT